MNCNFFIRKVTHPQLLWQHLYCRSKTKPSGTKAFSISLPCNLSNQLNDHLSLHQRRPFRRALLYVPGHDKRKIEKIVGLNADCVVLDCEDGVAFDKREEARTTIAEHYKDVASQSSKDVCVRINAPDSSLAQKDIECLFELDPVPTGLVVPKVNDYEELQWVCSTVTEIAGSKPRHNRDIGVVIMTETPRGLINIREIIEAGIAICAKRGSRCRIDGVIFGSDDFCASMGITRTKDSSELAYARQKIATTAKAFDLQAIDMVFIDYKDLEGVREQALEGFRMGFTGKQVIHPGQIEVVQGAFMPSPAKIEWALRLLKAHEECNEGVFIFDGQMIDLPTILQARNIADLHNSINNTTTI